MSLELLRLGVVAFLIYGLSSSSEICKDASDQNGTVNEINKIVSRHKRAANRIITLIMIVSIEVYFRLPHRNTPSRPFVPDRGQASTGDPARTACIFHAKWRNLPTVSALCPPRVRLHAGTARGRAASVAEAPLSFDLILFERSDKDHGAWGCGVKWTAEADIERTERLVRSHEGIFSGGA